MNIRPAISAPLPWLIILVGKIFSKKGPEGVARPRFKLPRSLSFTREGKWFTGVLLFIGIAAINTDKNLLYLVVATLLSLIIISGIMSESTLKGVCVKRILPEHFFKGSSAIVRLYVRNTKKITPSFSFKVHELPEDGLKADPVYLLKLSSGSKYTGISRYTFDRRGRFILTGIKVSTRFPFGLFIKGRVEDNREEVLVLPSIKPLKKQPPVLNMSPAGGLGSPVRGSGRDFYGLREYTFEDNSRFIHWGSLAKTSRLFVKEFEKESENRVFVVFENFLSGDYGAFEDAVDEAASLAGHFIERGYAVGLKTLTIEVRAGAGSDHLFKILRALALIGPADARGAPVVRVIS